MPQQDIFVGLQRVTTSEIDFLVRYLIDVSQQPSTQEGFRKQMNMLNVRRGHYILDVGCGLGERTFEMAKKVGPFGKVVGTDINNLMISVASGRYENSDLPLSFEMAEATRQPFQSEFFDIIRIERVLLYVHQVKEAFQEFSRLLKPGGKLLVFDLDLDALSIGHVNRPLTRKIVQFLSDSVPNGRMATELQSYFAGSSFRQTSVKAMSYLPNSLEFFKRVIGGTIESGIRKGVLDETEIKEWWSYLDNEDRKGTFWACFNGLIVMGEK